MSLFFIRYFRRSLLVHTGAQTALKVNWCKCSPANCNQKKSNQQTDGLAKCYSSSWSKVRLHIRRVLCRGALLAEAQVWSERCGEEEEEGRSVVISRHRKTRSVTTSSPMMLPSFREMTAGAGEKNVPHLHPVCCLSTRCFCFVTNASRKWAISSKVYICVVNLLLPVSLFSLFPRVYLYSIKIVDSSWLFNFANNIYGIKSALKSISILANRLLKLFKETQAEYFFQFYLEWNTSFFTYSCLQFLL